MREGLPEKFEENSLELEGLEQPSKLDFCHLWLRELNAESWPSRPVSMPNITLQATVQLLRSWTAAALRRWAEMP